MLGALQGSFLPISLAFGKLPSHTYLCTPFSYPAALLPSHDRGKSPGYIAEDAGAGGVQDWSPLPSPTPHIKAGGVITRSELVALRQGQASVPGIKPGPSALWAPSPLL